MLNKLTTAMNRMKGISTNTLPERIMNEHKIGRMKLFCPKGMRMTTQRKELFKAFNEAIKYCFGRSIRLIHLNEDWNENNKLHNIHISFDIPRDEEYDNAPTIVPSEDQEDTSNELRNEVLDSPLVYVCKKCGSQFDALAEAEQHTELYGHHRGIGTTRLD